MMLHASVRFTGTLTTHLLTLGVRSQASSLLNGMSTTFSVTGA